MPASRKTWAIKNCPKSTTVQSLKSFLRAVNFYRAKIPNFATIAAPLDKLLQGNSLVSHLWFLIKKPTSHLTTWSLFCAITPPWPILGQTLTLCSFLTRQTSAVALPSCSSLTTHGVQSRFSLLRNASTPHFPENFSDCTLLSNTFLITLRAILTLSCTVIMNLLWKLFIPATKSTTQDNVVT